MNKYLATLFALGMMAGTPLFAQNDSVDLFKQIDQSDAGKESPAASVPDQNSSTDQPPTIITATKESTFDGNLKMAVMYGDVKVKNPQFTLSSDKLTVYFHKDDQGGKKDPDTKKQEAASPSPAPTPKQDAPATSTQQGGGIEKVIAEGNVVIQSDRPDPKGGPPVHYAGKGDKVIYTPATGEAIFSGLPQLSEGINTMVATDDSTVIYLYRDGTMHADGPHKMEIHDPGPDKTPAPDKTPEVK